MHQAGPVANIVDNIIWDPTKVWGVWILYPKISEFGF